jgi:hypothetical protein
MSAITVFGSKAQAVRRVITRDGGKTEIDGIRTMARRKRIPPANPKNKEAAEKALEKTDKATDAFGGILGSISGDLQNLLSNISVTGVYSLFLAGALALYSFNWNTTDDEFEQAIKARELAWYGALGELTGHTVGWFLCGVVPGLVIGTFNEGMMLRVLADVGEEMYDELTDDLWALLKMGATHLAQNAASRIFMGLRALVKRAANEQQTDGPLGTALRMFFKRFPKIAETIKKWGEKGQKAWSFNSAINEWVESFPEGNLKEFLEEFLDALGEACMEAGYVVAGGADSWIAQNKVQQLQIQGQQRVVDVLLNRSDPESRIIVAGSEQQIIQTLISEKNNYQRMKRKDLGLLVGGEPIANTITTPGLPYMKFIFSADKNKKVKPTYIDIYNIDRTKVDNWNTLKMAVGGENGYMWGPYLIEAALPDNNIIRCFASSEDEGIDLLEQLSQFSKAEQDYEKVIWQSRHEIRKGTRKKYESTYKTPRRAYPFEVVIINQIAILNEENGKTTHTGTYTSNEAKIPLWGDKEPDNFKKQIQELFTTPGPNG